MSKVGGNMPRIRQKMFALVLVGISLLFPLASRVAAQDQVLIQGTVTDRTTGAPIQGVSVSPGGPSVLTDSNGNYSLTGVQVTQETGGISFSGAKGYFNYSTS